MTLLFSIVLSGALASSNKEALSLTSSLSGEQFDFPADGGHPQRPWTCWEVKQFLAPRVYREPQSIRIVHPTEARILLSSEDVPQGAGFHLSLKGLGASTIAEFLDDDDIFPLRAVATPEFSPIGMNIKSRSHQAIMKKFERKDEGTMLVAHSASLLSPLVIARMPKSFLKKFLPGIFINIGFAHLLAPKYNLVQLQTATSPKIAIPSLIIAVPLVQTLIHAILSFLYRNNPRPIERRNAIRILHERAKHLAEENKSSTFYGWFLLMKSQLRTI
jgi:hypothetical protein